MIGRVIAHYRIIELLGEGAMGVVYRAEDTQLGRTVALKFLVREAIGDADVKARLVREAQAAAALDHPNICPVYGIHEQDGEMFISMGFVDGPSLSEKIQERPLPISEALDCAIQIAEGLKEAHGKGVFHRDLKPANVRLTQKGQVKLLDFGLAHVTGRSRLTKSGTTLGTPAYMSPEQALGQETDRRTDVWSLGVVLYEMLTGRLPFDADYQQAIIYEIVNQPHEPVTARRAGLPLELDRIIDKSLAKSPAERYQHVDDFATDLALLKKRISSPPTVSPIPAGSASADSSGIEQRDAVVAGYRRKLHWSMAGLGVVLIVLFVLIARTVPPRPKSPLLRLQLASPDATSYRAFALSPDGARLAFVDEGIGISRLWVQSLIGGVTGPLAGTEGADPNGVPFWSPDGQHIGFFGNGMLKRIGLDGSGLQSLAPAPSGRGGTWNRTGSIAFAPDRLAGIYRVPDSGGKAEALTTLDEGRTSHRAPSFLPDGRHFLFIDRRAQTGRIRLGTLDSPDTSVVADDERDAIYSSSPGSGLGWRLYGQDGTLMARRFDVSKASAAGEQIPIANGVAFDSVIFRHLFSVSENGLLAYLPAAARSRQMDLVRMDRSGRILARITTLDSFAFSVQPETSGRFAIVQQFDEKAGIPMLSRVDLERRLATRIRPEEKNAAMPFLLPDQQSLLFAAPSPDNPKIYRAKWAGGPAETIVAGGAGKLIFPCGWSPDGRYMLFQRLTPAVGWDILMLRLDGRSSPQPFIESRFNEAQAAFSPNGRWVAYISDETGNSEIYVTSFPEGRSRIRISEGGGIEPRWGAEGRELFFVSGAGVLMSVKMEQRGEEEIRPSPPERLFEVPLCWADTPPYDFSPVYKYAPSAGGREFLCLRRPEELRFPPLQIVIDWMSQVER